MRFSEERKLLTNHVNVVRLDGHGWKNSSILHVSYNHTPEPCMFRPNDNEGGAGQRRPQTAGLNGGGEDAAELSTVGFDDRTVRRFPERLSPFRAAWRG
jgi:hypothetical protein